MAERHYVIERQGAGWVFTIGEFRSSLFGTPGMAADVARTAAKRAHRDGDDTRILFSGEEGRRTIWRHASQVAASR
jgi:hypothetical protein